MNIIYKFFSSTKRGLGKTTLTSHTIDVGSSVPVKRRYYPVSPKVQADLYSEIDRMLRLIVIDECPEDG